MGCNIGAASLSSRFWEIDQLAAASFGTRLLDGCNFCVMLLRRKGFRQNVVTCDTVFRALVGHHQKLNCLLLLLFLFRGCLVLHVATGKNFSPSFCTSGLMLLTVCEWLCDV